MNVGIRRAQRIEENGVDNGEDGAAAGGIEARAVEKQRHMLKFREGSAVGVDAMDV